MPLHEGTIVFDGGVSFGAVPRAAWSKIMPPDANNCVLFGVTFFLVQGHGNNVLIDTGMGTKRSSRQEQEAGFGRVSTADELLANAGVSRESIDIVVMTHLHYASAGNLTYINREGVLEPTFPKARVVIQKDEWEQGIHTNIRTRGLYEKEDFEPLLWHQQVELVQGDTQLLPGFWCRVTGGHTKAHQIAVIESGGEGAVFWGDLIPSTHHLHLNAISAHDLMPLDSMEKKAEWLTRAIDRSWVNFFFRDSAVAAAQISGDGMRLSSLECEILLSHDGSEEPAE